MSREDYLFADLQPDVVEELRKTEQRLSEKCGEPITLIAYRSDAQPDSDAENQSNFSI